MENLCNFFLGDYPNLEKGSISLATLQKNLEALENVCSEAFYVIDLKRHDFFYKSRKLAAYLARYGDAAYGSSLEQFLHCIPDADAALYRDFGQVFGALFNRTAVLEKDSLLQAEKYSLVLSGNFRLITDRRYTMVYVRATPLTEDADGNMSLSLCTLRASSAQQAGGVQITKGKGEAKQVYSMQKKDWLSMDEVGLCDYEQDVLRLAARGFTTDEIANSINHSTDSVKRYRKSVLKKLEVENIVQAVLKAQNLGLI